jgi:Na+-transporting NADH:ubiquinone oxidoreductase subunit C
MVDPATVRNASAARALMTAVGVAMVCALLVSYAAVTLRPYYIANLEAERNAQLDSILNALSSTAGDIDPGDVEARVVELDSGLYSRTLDAATYDARKAATDPTLSTLIPPQIDLAGIKYRPDHAVVFMMRNRDGTIRILILPVYGVGYQSTLYGFLALAADTNTVLALRFYEQNDTPGIGARIQDPAWEALWPEKRVFDEAGELRTGVARGSVTGGSPDADYMVDGISGATRTSLGVHGLLRFWLGDFGFGPYLARVREGGG